MAHLSWRSKKAVDPAPAALRTDGILYPGGAGYPDTPPRNALIHGDNLAVMSALLPRYEGRIQLIYADPPFFTNRHYPARVGRGEDSRRPKEWQLVEGYPDDWDSLDSYLDMLYPRLVLMHRLLAETGTLYLHLDWHANAYARVLLDEIFGADRLLNEIIWVYHGPSPIRSAFNRKHDTILAYTKSQNYTFNVDAVRQPYDSNTVKTFASSPKAGFGKVPDLARGKVPEDWWYFPVVARLHSERTGFPTQKPEALLQRIVLASSNPGDLVADFFAGSGTLGVAAHRCGRDFMLSDVTWRAIHTTRVRLAGAVSEPVALQAVKLPDAPPLDQLSQIDDPGATWLVLSGDELKVELPEALLAALDYWEVDPDWDGKIFRSVTQVTRPRKDGAISRQATIPFIPGARPVCVQFVSVDGGRSQVVCQKPGSR
jgi:DNA modification methylase